MVLRCTPTTMALLTQRFVIHAKCHILRVAQFFSLGSISLPTAPLKKFILIRTTGRTLLRTLVDKTLVPDKDEAARLCHLNFKVIFDGETHHPAEDLKKVQNYTMDITGGDNRKRGLEWVQSIWDRPQVLSYDMEMISQVFDDLSLGVKIEAAANEYIEKIKC
jgi:hypothetical protein